MGWQWVVVNTLWRLCEVAMIACAIYALTHLDKIGGRRW